MWTVIHCSDGPSTASTPVPLDGSVARRVSARGNAQVADLGVSCSPDGIRTRATALRGRRARPLHNGAESDDRRGGELYRAGVPGLEPRLTEPESVVLQITPYPTRS